MQVEFLKLCNMKKLLFLFVALGLTSMLLAQKDTTKKQVPTGIKLGGIVPAISYNTDVGFRYGALMNIYDWGDGSLYPDYLRSLYLEASKTTKGSGQLIVEYDDKAFLGSNIRLIGNLGYYVEQALDFYGFNGYESVFHLNWMTTGDSNYVSRMYYRLDRRVLRAVANLQIPIEGKKIRGYAGLGFLNFRLNSVNVDKMNKGLPADKQLPSPDTVPGLYELYQKWGVITPAEAHGGKIGMIRLGLIYDTRDNEPMPNRGIWTEGILIGATDFAHSGYTYLQFVATHRQYFTIFPKRLIFAYRLSWSQILAGKAPFYMLPWYHSTKNTMEDAFGGAKTLRGIMRDRIIADGVAFGNVELRFRVINTRILGQDFYVALSSFVDGAIITKRHEYNLNFQSPGNGLTQSDFFNFNAQQVKRPHLGVGGGIRFGLNENFIVAVDYGKALNAQDGTSGLYIGLNWLF